MPETALPLVRIQLMGPLLVVHQSGQRATFRYEKLKALLGYVSAQSDQAHRRSDLANLLWPDGPHDAALGNLRRALFDLRKEFERLGVTCPIFSDRRVVKWAPSPEVRVMRSQDADPMTSGLFLADVRVDDSPAWHHWLQTQREQVRQSRLMQIDEDVRRNERRGDWPHAVALARQRLALSPEDEAGHRQLIQLLMQHGQLDQARQAYQVCEGELLRLGQPGLGDATLAIGRALKEAELRAGEGAASALGRSPLTLLAMHLVSEQPGGELGRRHTDGRHPVIQLGGQLSRLSDRLWVGSFGGPTPQEHTPQRAWEALRRHLQSAPGIEGWRWQASIVHAETRLAPGYPTPDASGDALSEALSLAFATPAGKLTLNPSARLLLRRDLPPDSNGQVDSTHALDSLPPLRINAGLCPWLSDAESPPVGRRTELEGLLSWWGRSDANAPDRLHVEGEAGVGKTRLLRHLASRVLDEGSRMLLVQADPLWRHHPWHALKQAVQERARDAAEEGMAWRLTRLRRAWGHALGTSSAAWASLTRLLELPSPLDDPGIPTDVQRQHLEQGLLELLHAWCGQRPLLLVIEDTHWLDDATWQTVLRLLAHPSWPHRWKVLSSARTGEGLGPVSAVLELAPLDREATSELALQLAEAADVGLPPGELQQLVDQAEGVPLFLEQLIHARQDPSGRLTRSAPGLQEFLLARMHRLGPHLALAQAAACTGRCIDLPLLTRQQMGSRTTLLVGLEALQRAGMVQVNGSQWRFRHALIQAAALATMSPEARQAVHRQLAEIMRGQMPDRIREAPERLAQHLHEARSPDAAAAWLAAARHFNRRSETAAARHHLQLGLEALTWLHNEAACQDMAFRLWVEMGHTLVALEGYGSQGSRKAYATALALADRVSDDGDLFQLMWGMWLGSRTVDEQAPPMAFAERLARAARDSTDPRVQLQVHYAFGNNHFWLAQYPQARNRLEEAVALAKAVDTAQMIALYGEASHVCALSFLSWIDWIEGDTDRALIRSDEAVAQGRRSGHAHTLCFALAFSATLQRYLDRPQAAAQQAAALGALAREHRLGLWQATAAAVAGWAQARTGDASALTPIRDALAGAKQAMAAVETTFQAFLADALVHLHHWDEAIDAIDEALRTAHAIPDVYLLPELLRLRAHAEAALAPADRITWGATLQEAEKLAQTQGAIAMKRRIELSRDQLRG